MNTPATIRVIARGSPLSRIQTGEGLERVQPAFPGVRFETRWLESVGDKDLKTPLTDPSVPTDFFTRELDDELLADRADVAVHSAKDLPDPLPEGIALAALLPARDTRDALAIRPGLALDDIRVVGTSSPTREAAIRERWPEATCKAIRGNIGQRLAQLDAGDYDAVIIAACALERLGLADRVSDLLDYETTPQQGRLAFTVRADRHDLLKAFRAVDVRRTAGLVALVGCPADPRLLGGHALDLLEAADIVLHDRLVPQSVLDSLGDRAEYVGKKGHSHSTTQAHIHRRILHEAEAGKLVVRLHGGDPGVLGHLGETLDFCHAWNFRTEVVPAVSAAQLTAARARCALTHRHQGRSITFLSGHKGLEDHAPAALTPEHGNLAVYMGVRDITAIQKRLREAGWPEHAPVTAGIDLGGETERLIPGTLADIADRGLESPAVLLVGPAPHTTPVTLFTGTNPKPFLKHGPLHHFPMINQCPRPLGERVRLLQAGLETWDGLIFPSGFAVDLVIDTLMSFADTRALANKTLLAVGPHTARALDARGLKADAAPKDFGGATALAELPNLPKGTYGYPTSDQSPVEERKAALANAGITLAPAVFYETRPTEPTRLPQIEFNRVIFTSGSTVKTYFDRFPEERQANREWLAVGASTQKALEGMLPAPESVSLLIERLK